MYSRRFYCTGSNIRLSQVEYCLGQAPSIGPSLSASSSSLLGWPLCLNCAARSPSQAEAAGVVELEGPVHLGGPSAARSPVTSQAVGRRERAEKIETHTLRSKSDFGLISSFAAGKWSFLGCRWEKWGEMLFYFCGCKAYGGFWCQILAVWLHRAMVNHRSSI